MNFTIITRKMVKSINVFRSAEIARVTNILAVE